MFRNGLQPSHVILVLIILVLLFGARRLPDVAKSVGQSLKIFKSEIKDLKGDDATPGAVPPVASAPAEQGSPAPGSTPSQTTAPDEPPATPPASAGPDQVPPAGAAPQA
jgi:sec-independent protein translocase protein TatA